MNRLRISFFILLCTTLAYGADSFKLENRYLSRIVSIKDGILKTTTIRNKRIKKDLPLVQCNEFALRISKGVGVEGDDKVLTNVDFRVEGTQSYKLKGQSGQGYLVRLKDVAENIELEVYYELAASDFYTRKFIKLIPRKSLTLERIDVENIASSDAFQPYKLNEIYAWGPAHWKPNLGQPLYTTESAMFWGIEFPAAVNMVNDHTIQCGYQVGDDLKPGQEYTSYKAVVGVADNKNYLDDSFYEYIDRIRKRPLRLQIQYNSWFDFGQGVTKQSFAHSVRIINNELVVKRGCRPLNAYVVDDGWQVNNIVTSDTVWRINQKFDPAFSGTFNLVDSLHSSLGLWLSPGCCFGAKPMVAKFREMGFEALTNTMSMTGSKYMQKLEDRILDLTRLGVTYFKFDGSFGHLNIRDFELKGRGTPAMPQLGLSDTIREDSKLLNDSKYNELKVYYLTKGSERLIQMFDKMAEINPSVYIAITNGAYLSPWWMQYVDVVWLINAGDAANGTDRTDELVYRDNIYYNIWKQENTKFPMNAIFNHEPKKNKQNLKESKDEFRNYLFMNLSRGTGFIELYLKTDSLKTTDWDVIAEGLKWSYKYFPSFKHVRMIGGNPSEKQVYGYAGWGDKLGYVSLHNPSDRQQTFEIELNREVGFNNGESCKIGFRLNGNNLKGVNKLVAGQKMSITLKPKEIFLIGYKQN